MKTFDATLLLRYVGEESVRLQRYACLSAETHAAAFLAAMRAASEEYERHIDRLLMWDCRELTKGDGDEK